jgi:hypothetical protein
MTDIPEALAQLVKDKHGWLWVVSKCPLCGKRHVHGGGPLDGDPHDRLGHRAAHCVTGDTHGGYVLKAVE